MKWSTLTLMIATLVGCSKPSPEEQKKREDELAAAFASALASSAPSAPAGTTAAANPATPSGGIGATCNNKGDAKCTESRGAEGFAADESCKKLGGVYTKGPTPCPQDNLLGTCTRADATTSLNDIDYYYKQAGTTADAMKSLCEGVMSGKWTPAPPAAKGAPKKK